MQHESKLDISKVITVKMEKTENSAKKRKYFPQFTASMGIEGLLFIIDRFKNNTMKLNFTVGEK